MNKDQKKEVWGTIFYIIVLVLLVAGLVVACWIDSNVGLAVIGGSAVFYFAAKSTDRDNDYDESEKF